MYRKWVICLSVLVLLLPLVVLPVCAEEPERSDSPWIEIYDKVSDGVVMMTVGILYPDGRRIKALGSGSGFIVKQDKYETLIVTNNHVAAGADFIHVWHPALGEVDPIKYYSTYPIKYKKGTTNYAFNYRFGKEEPPQAKPYRVGRVVALDPVHDLALVSVKYMPKLTSLKIADYPVRVGQDVMGIGYPLGLWLTANAGIISRIDVDLAFLNKSYKDRILTQYDAWINGGNSGGPVFDLNGQVVGVSCASLARGMAGVPTGMNFMVPHRFITKDLMGIYEQWKLGWYGMFTE